MRIGVSVFIFLVIISSALAQKDTVYLQEVEVAVPRLLKYSYGGSTITIEKNKFNQNLNDLISTNTSTYFKNYGNGQLSTISFRGTTAVQTAVIWNGIQVNSPTLGLTDFSLWPSYLLNDVSVHLGGSSANFGSGAIGGTVLLSQSEPFFENNLKSNVKLEYGSFGNYTTAGTFLFSNNRIVSQTKIYRNSIDNNFEIVSENRNQNNASVLRYGFDQQFSYKINEAQVLKFEGLYIHNHRQIQPFKFNTFSTDELKDESLRLSLNYRNEAGKGIWNTTFGYIIDDQRFNKSSKIKANQASVNSTFDIPLNNSMSLKTGLLFTNFSSDVDSYINQVNENRLDGFTALNWEINNWWRISFNLRKGFYTNKSFPFIPSIGQEFDIIKTENNSLKLKSLISKSFRIPTLNDRFWGTQGNPDLQSEEGKNIEVGLIWKESNKTSRFDFSLSHYRSWIDELIIWLPTGSSGIFIPQNNKEVHSMGFEVSANWSKTLNDGKLSARLNYNYTKSTNKKGLSGFDQTGVNKQLPYVPFHTGNLSVTFEKNGWTVNTCLEYTGDRFTTLDNSSFNQVVSFQLFNISVSKTLKIRSMGLNPYLKLNNIMNKDYENFKNYAMPGRNFLLGIDFNF